jgi:mannose-6-phosphate isomerase-like protein (cupin superfamily)
MAAARLMLSSSLRYRACRINAASALESIRVADYGCKISHAGRRGGKNASGEGRVFKILHLNECPASPMEPGRGEQIRLINPGLGTEKVDVHLNRLVPGGPRGKVHHHTEADNVYIVKRGEGTLTVEGKTYLIRENDVVYIPAGMKHALANVGSELFEIFEIYAPSGRHFDFVVDE